MKFFTNFFILLFISTAVNLSQSGGIKVSGSMTRYFNHDLRNGIESLRKEVSNEILVSYNGSNTTPSAISGKLTAAGYCRQGYETSDALRFISMHRDIFGLMNAESELHVLSYITDDISMKHIKFQQYVNNIKIYPSELVVHINKDGSIESVNGNFIPTPLINFAAYISSEAARSISITLLGSYKAEDIKSEFIYYRKGISIIPAYEVRMPSKDFPEMKLFIDARDGSLIYKDDGLRYDGPMVGSGISLNGTTRQIHTYLFQSKYYLVDASLPMYVPPFDSLTGVVATYDAKNSTTGNGYDQAELVWDPNSDNNFNDNVGLRAAVDAHFYTRQVYTFYRNNFNRNSYSGTGLSLINVVHYKVNYNNAFWNGFCLTYGDGDGQNFSNLAGALDVITHEMTHGVISSTADLVYRSQTGAMNESFADVFACLHDSTDWLIGEDVYTPSIPGDALRNMQDPHNGAPQGSNNWQPAHMSEYVVLPETEEGDWGGVHVNSGIPNKAFYNAAAVIGRWKAGQIWYRTLSVYLTSNSQFRDLRINALLAAKDLYGMNSSEYNAVKDAFDGVGITENTTSTYELIYDDGNPNSDLYENLPNWKIAVMFTSPAPSISVNTVAVYITGDANNGSGTFALELFDQNNQNLPGNPLISPYTYTPQNVGWQEFNVTGVNVSTNFYVSALYDGVNWPMLGADFPPGTGRTFEYDPNSHIWTRLTGTFDYTVFMRAAVSSTVSDILIESAVPENFNVSESYPNPFNPSTTIKYELPAAQKVLIAVYDINGRRVAELANNFHNAGSYTISWNGKNSDGYQVSSGIYYCRIEAGDYSAVRKMVLMK